MASSRTRPTTEFFDVAGPTPIEAVVPRRLWVQPADVALEDLSWDRPTVVHDLPTGGRI